MNKVMLKIVYKMKKVINIFSEPSYQYGRDNYPEKKNRNLSKIHLMNLSRESKITKSKC
jgi:hypothetical protein